MKLRQGFVSNSSSCSFTIYGVCFDWDYKEIYDALQDDVKARCFIEQENSTISEDTDLDILEKVLGEEFKHLTIQHGQECYSFYVGYTLNDMGDDETKNQFYSRVKTSLQKVFKDVSSISWYEESWFDG